MNAKLAEKKPCADSGQSVPSREKSATAFSRIHATTSSGAVIECSVVCARSEMSFPVTLITTC